MDHFVGIDFGTTNSAIALADPGGDVRLATIWRTVLYFDEVGGRPIAGAPGIAAYLDAEGDGRLVQSIKSHLASSAFSKIFIHGNAWTLEQLIAEYLRQLRRAAGIESKRAVVGRPVRYWGAEDAEDEARALTRMRAAMTLAGFEEIVFEYEPVAAAARYAARLERDELVLVADYGGGTSDFSLMRVGPGANELLATGGLGIGGDSFDARIIDAEVAPRVGRGTRFLDEFGADLPVPVWLFSRLRRWHQLSFLKQPDTLRLLDRIERGAIAREPISRLVRLVRDDLGLPLHHAVELAKHALTGGDDGELRLAQIELAAHLRRDAFEAWIEPDLAQIDRVVEQVLRDASVAPGEVDRVFATGGSSLVPAVRARLAARFGADTVVGGEELTSVCWGLAARARQLLAPGLR
jgi:hypothetical chaperone protein